MCPFEAVSLFKRSAHLVPDTPAAHEALTFWRERTGGHSHFLYYTNGKSACRVAPRACVVVAWRALGDSLVLSPSCCRFKMMFP